MISSRTISILALACMVGCGHPAAAPATAAAPAPAPVVAPVAPDAAPADPDLAELETMRATICACKDGACVEQVAIDHQALITRIDDAMKRGVQPNEPAQAVIGKIKECATKLPPPPGVIDGTEADLALDRLQVLVKQYYDQHHAFPVGVERATPAGACCAQPHNMCASTAADWRTDKPGHPWAELGFSVLDDRIFQYDYQGTATEFTVHATADWDCDASNGGTTYTVRGRVVGGQPVIEVERPAARH
jgi:hypothetical protein